MKADLDARTLDPAHESVDWDLGSLRKMWNRAKDSVAPWWAANSKELRVYNRRAIRTAK